MKETPGKGLLDKAEKLRDSEASIGIAIKREALPHPETDFAPSSRPYGLSQASIPGTMAEPLKKGGFTWLLVANTLLLLLVGATVFFLATKVLGQEGSHVKSPPPPAIQPIVEAPPPPQASTTMEKDSPFSDLGAALELSLRAREAELWTKLKAEVGAEAKALGTQGLSPAQAASRLSTFEDDKTAALQATLMDYRRQAEAAKTALMDLSEKGLGASPMESSLSELFAGLRLSLARGDYAEAQVKARNLQANLAEPGAATGLSGSRETYLFAADALAGLAVYQLQSGLGDASLLLSQAQALEAAKAAASEASRAAAAGNFGQAERAYTKALALVPPAMEAHRYFVARSDAADEQRKKNLTSSIARGASAYDRGEYNGSRAAYLEALGYLPLGSKDRNRFLEAMESTARRLDARSRQVSQTKAAQEAFAKAKAALGEGRYEEAYAGYVAILSKLPSSAQAEESVAGANAAMQGLVQSKAQALDESTKNAQALQTRVDELVVQLEELKTAQSEVLRHQEEDAAAALESLRAEKDRVIQELQTRLSEVEASTLAALGEGSDTLKKSYAEYCARQDAILAGDSSKVAAESYENLAAFLDKSPFEAVLPGYGQRLKKDLDAIKASSSQVNADLGAETEISLALLKLSSLEGTPEEKAASLETLSARYKDEPRLQAFIDGLAKGLGLRP